MVRNSRKHYFQKILQIESLSVDAAAIFGSFARGDSDSLSDRDLLLVGDNSKILRTEASRLENFGWSCSTLTWSQLSHAGKRKLLFIQHLKLEGIVIKDNCDRLLNFLHSAEPRSDYSWEIEQAKDLIGLIEDIPLNEWGSVWALDVLMVGFRSLGYATLANEGMFRFSFDEVLNKLHTIGFLKSSDLPILRALRKWKHSFREGIISFPISNEQTLKLISLVDKRIQLGFHVNYINPKHFILKQDEQIDNSQHWYRNSRSLEAVVRLHPEKYNASLLRQLCSPQGYSFTIKKLNSKAIISQALAA